MSNQSSVQVAVRIRPLNVRELDAGSPSVVRTVARTLSITNPDDSTAKQFTYDYIYDSDSSQEQVYEDIGKAIIKNSFSGYNSCIFAYGQTGCFAADTPIMLYTGQYKSVQDIVPGDQLMGDDCEPRTVLRLFQGSQQMYKIDSGDPGHTSYVVNADHLLVLYVHSDPRAIYNSSKGYYKVRWYDWQAYRYHYAIFLSKSDAHQAVVNNRAINCLEITVTDFLTYVPAKYRKHYWCSTRSININQPIENPSEFYKSMVRHVCTVLSDDLAGAETTILPVFKYTADFMRMKLLETVLDFGQLSDNNQSTGLHISTGSNYEITVCSLTLADDIIWIARSLGFYAIYQTILDLLVDSNQMICYRCTIQSTVYANITSLNTKYKEYIVKQHNKPVSFNPIIRQLDNDIFYGFEIDGNNRFIGAGFNILRNSGKSHSMMGDPTHNPGLIPRIFQGLFDHITTMRLTSSADTTFNVELSYLEIYSEEVKDLLAKDHKSGGLKVRLHKDLGPYVEGLTHVLVTDYTAVKCLIEQGNRERTVASTLMNQHSSRSHAIMTIHFTQRTVSNNVKKEIQSRINLVDLAGSEKVESSGVIGINFTEAISINKSLSALGTVINKLAEMKSGAKLPDSKLSDKKKQDPVHIPFRNSVLTFILKESLGGNSKTYMLAAISPAAINYAESLNTLRYAANAKKIVNTVTVNENTNDKVVQSLNKEIEELKRQMKTASAERQRQLEEQLVEKNMLLSELQKTVEQKDAESKTLLADFQRIVDEQNKRLSATTAELELTTAQLEQEKAERLAAEEQAKRQLEEERRLLKERQIDFEQGAILGTSIKLQEYYENKLSEKLTTAEHIYENKLDQNSQQWQDKLTQSNQQWQDKLDQNSQQWQDKLTQSNQQWQDKLTQSNQQWQDKLDQTIQHWQDKLVQSNQQWEDNLNKLNNKISTLEHDNLNQLDIINKLTQENTKLRNDIQLQLKRFTEERAVLTRQIHNLQMCIQSNQG